VRSRSASAAAWALVCGVETCARWAACLVDGVTGVVQLMNLLVVINNIYIHIYYIYIEHMLSLAYG
jgi:hypothetical protein